MTIKRLPDHLARKIAAGEVVERPVSVVKELLENSLDAGASQVEVELAEGGKVLISVTDNGSGIAGEDMPLAVEKHATSKISAEEDLEAIGTLGYRGEALASIASVSILELYSRKKDRENGTVLCFEKDQMVLRDTPLKPGTQVIVKDLFYNLPVRRKFMKSSAAEFRRILRLIQDYALAWPSVAFKLIHDSRVVFQSVGDKTVEGALTRIWGKEPETAYLEFEAGNLKARLWWQDCGAGSRFQLISFVNGRRIVDSSLRAALLSHPWANRGNWLLMLTLPLEDVDVNVHPAKTEILFRRSGDVFDVVRRCAEGFSRHFSQLVPGRASSPVADSSLEHQNFPGQSHRPGWQADGAPANPFSPIASPFRVSSGRASRDVPGYHGGAETSGDQSFSFRQEISQEPSVFQDVPQNEAFYLGQLPQGYLLFMDVKGLLIIDPHAAHERVNYERIMSSARQSGGAEQLLVPMALPPTLAEDVAHHRQALNELGFSFDDDGRLLMVPIHASARLGALEMLRGAVAALEDRQETNHSLLERWAMKACKASVKITGRLESSEALCLYQDLMNCENPNACPHGRPTVLILTGKTLDDHFGRNGL